MYVEVPAAKANFSSQEVQTHASTHVSRASLELQSSICQLEVQHTGRAISAAHKNTFLDFLHSNSSSLKSLETLVKRDVLSLLEAVEEIINLIN